MNARITSPKRRTSALVLFWITNFTQLLLAIMAVLGAAVIVGAVVKLVWRAFSFGWTLWI